MQKGSIVFVDVVNAFYSINSRDMLHIQENYLITDETIKAIIIIYENPSSFVQNTDSPTKEF